MESTDYYSYSAAEDNFALGINGFNYSDLYEPERLRALTEIFYETVAAADPVLWRNWQAYLTSGGEGFTDKAESNLIVYLAPYLERFIARMFHIEAEVEMLHAKTDQEKIIIQFKRNFIQRRVLKKYNVAQLAEYDFALLTAQVAALQHACFPDTEWEIDSEFGVAKMVVALLELEREYEQCVAKQMEVDLSARSRVAGLRAQLGNTPVLTKLLSNVASQTDPVRCDFELIKQLLTILETWSFVRHHQPEHQRELSDWISYRHPETLNYTQLVKLNRPKATELPEMMYGPAEQLRRRDGFKLTDPRYTSKQVYNEVDYCLYCHERDKDSCSKGFTDKEGHYQQNPLGIPLKGCPLDEKISEAHLLKRDGNSLAALATVMIDNPMAPGTGHRICNDCMKSCIFQKQEPVNIPQIETGILSDVLNLPYGFEIYSLLTRWNPLNVHRPYLLPYNGKNILVVGLGPAGYTLAHYLLNEGFGVVGIDGLKIEPLPKELVGNGHTPKPIRNFSQLYRELDERVLMGFGGVSEYGITVRWDKNFLTVIYLTLMRRANLRIYGGVRFGGTVTIDDAWQLGFDHIAIATGAGKPTIIPMKNNLIRGIRKASDFLMALQLTGAYKRSALANLQVQLPAIVIGGGLTAIDTATEMLAYYPVQVEKILERFEKLAESLSEERIWAIYDAEEREILKTFLQHGHAVRAERERARRAGEEPDLISLVRAWGGVSIVYRKSLLDSPAYRLNHEEVIKALEEGIAFIENLSPLEAIPDQYGAVSALKFERMRQQEDGKWRASGEEITLPARTVCVAAGTSPNIIYEKEYPGTFKLDKWNEFFAGFKLEQTSSGNFTLVPAGGDEEAFFTSYQKQGHLISYYGDNHPAYAGNVVKAMASAKHGYRHICRLFADELTLLDPKDQSRRDLSFQSLVSRLDDELKAVVVRVNRLTPTIVEVIVRAPLAAKKFQPGQFYRLQNYEVDCEIIEGTRLMMEGIALTGAWVDPEQGWLSLIVLEMGVSSRLCAALQPGQTIIVMGPTGSPTEIPSKETVLLAGGGLGNAVLFSIAKALRERANRVIYFAGYKKREDLFKREEIEAVTDQVIWSVDIGELIEAHRPQDRSFRGNIVQAIKAYGEGALSEQLVPLCAVDRIIAIGSDRMMAAVKDARKTVLAPQLRGDHVAIGSINSPMQCMMKEVCAQCLQKHVDPITGAEAQPVFSCFNQDQQLDKVDFINLNARLRANSVQEKLSNLWLDYLFSKKPVTLV
ncbi:MAG: FAD-dependent oxidoreductase [Acidobacteriota bacterium]